uniref:Uncharacterized protein n=1 Tax=Anguilla anguilla TaxID=7936 RepID=A0A0E9Q0F4_ANGAN
MTKCFGIGLIASCINVSFMTDPQCPWVSTGYSQKHHITSPGVMGTDEAV